MGTVTIRRLRREDKAEWQALWQAYLTFYETELLQEVTDTLFERLLGEGYHDALVAEGADGRLAGLVHYLFHASTWATGSTCYLEDLYVDGSLRGGGVGKQLIEAVYREATTRGTGKVYWHTHTHNSRARRLYDHVGSLSDFVKYERP